jgi:3-oxoacyl-[acyl-carrier-protein] synthase-1
VLDLESGAMVPVMGHPLRGVTEGFSFLGLWVRIAEIVVGDVIRYGNLPAPEDARFWSTCHLVLVTPALDAGRFPLLDDEEPDPSSVLAAYVDSLLELTGLPFGREKVQTVPTGHVGVGQALEMVARRISAREMQRCLVVAVDSYLESDAIDWLARGRRLKFGDNPVGLSPGEAGAAFLVESPRAARDRNGRVEAWVKSVALGDTKRPAAETNAQRDGIALADSLSAVLPAEPSFRGHLVTDLNGEEWRAREFGGALARLGARFGDVDVVYPAKSLGDTGAAGGAIGVCLAARAFRRNYSRSNVTIVTSLSDSGAVSAIRLDHPEESGGSARKA